jgi:hypothetical protein
MRIVALPPIGGDSGSGHVFGRVADIEIGEDGSVFVLDELSRAIHVFSEQGTLLRSFGRRGRGPGELERPAALTWGPGGDLWVFDAANARFTVFDPQGRLLATYRSPDPEMIYPWAISFSASGLLYTVSSGMDLVNQEFRLVESEVADGGIRELRRIDLPFIEQPADFVHQGEGTVLVLPIPFSSLPVLRIGPDGHFWYANTRAPWIRRNWRGGRRKFSNRLCGGVWRRGRTIFLFCRCFLVPAPL